MEICEEEKIHSENILEVKKEMLSDSLFKDVSNLYKIFGDLTRVKILWALDKKELCVCDICNILNMTKSAISHQLKDLRDANLVRFRKEGKTVFYSLKDSHVKVILEIAVEHIKELED
jgi:ArsR family transcriptional regulator